MKKSVKKIISSVTPYTDPVETMAEVASEVPPAWGPDEKLRIVGTRQTRIDGHELVSGTAQYTTDIHLSNMLIAK